MKKNIFKNFVLSGVFFLVSLHSHAAQTVTVVNNTTSVTASPLTSQLSALLYEVTVTSTGTTSAKPLTMTFTATTNPSLETGSITLYTYNSATFPGTANATPLATITNPTTSMVFTFAAQNIAALGGVQYFFLVENFSRPTTVGSIGFQCSAINNNAGTLGNTLPGAAITSNWAAAVSVTYSAYNTPGSNGLPANPITNTQSSPVIYGFSLTGGAATGGATATAINQLTFTDGGTTGGANSNFFANIALYSSTTSNFTGVGNSGSTLVQSVASDGTTAATFTGLNLTISPSAVTYYFIVVTPSFTVSAPGDYKLNYTSNSGTMGITAATATNGYDYTITPPTYTLANNNSNIQAATTPYYYSSTGDVLESIAVSSTSSGVILNSFTLATYIAGANSTPYTNYFSNLQLFSSPTANYATAQAASGSAGLTAVTFTNTGTTTNPIITLGNAQALGTAPLYYFLVADFIAGDNLFTNTTTATTFLFNLTAINVTYSGGTALATNTFPISSNKYNLLSPIAFGNSAGTGLAGVNSLNTNQTQVGILGFSLTSAVPETVNTISFSANIVPSTSEINAFFANVKLYYNTTDNAATATAVTAGYTVSSLNGKTFTISGLAISTTATTIYYYIKADFTAPSTFSSTFQLSATSCTTTTPLTCTAGVPVNGPVYNLSPAIILGNATGTGLASNPIISTQNGNTLTIFDFSLYSGPANTVTTLNLASVQPAGQYLGTSFSGYALYVNTGSNSLTGATLVTGATFSSIAASNTLTISGLSQSIPAGSTYYYFIKAVYISPSLATTYQLNLNSVATSTATYTTGGPINGINYTLSGPLGVYYWEGQTQTIFGTTYVTNSTWENAQNWLNANTNTLNNGYPDKSVNNDIAVFSGSYIKANVCNITSSKTISQMLVSIDQAYSMDIQIANGLTCTVTNAFTLGDPGLVNPVYTTPPANGVPRSQLILDETSGTGGTGQYFISGTSSIYNDGSLAISGPTTFSPGSVFNLYGTTNDPAVVGIFGATATATNVTWNLTGNGSFIYTDLTAGSTLNVTNSTINFTGFSAQISNFGAATFTNCLFNSTTISNNNYLSGLGCSAGTLTVTGASIVNLGTTSSNGNYNELQNTGGTFNVSGSTIVNMRGPSSYIYNDYTKAVDGGTTRNPTYTPQAIFNINASTINMGTSSGSDGSNVQIYNTDAGYFNLNAGGILNMYGTNATIDNATDANSLGTTGYGLFQAAPTSFINPASTTSVINNVNASNYFTLLSNTSASATIGKLASGGKILGKYDVQRYLNGGASYLRNYRLLSSPVNITGTYSSQYNKVDMSYPGATATIPYIGTVYNGAFILGPDATFGGGYHTIPNPGMYLYQENIAPGSTYRSSFTSGKYVGIASLGSGTITTKSSAAGAGSGSAGSSPSQVSSPISLPGYDNSSGMSVPPGNAYIMYYIDNNTRTTAASVTTSPPNASTVTASGYINQNQVQVFMWATLSGSLTDTYGFSTVRSPGITMVGNPYSSTIDLNTVYTDNSSTITPTLYQLDKTTQQFDSYNAAINGSSTSLSSEYVASGQGFYIHVDSLGSSKLFAFREGEKTPYGSPGFYPPISQFDIPSGPTNTVDNVNVPSGPAVTADNVNVSSGTKVTDNLNTASASNNTGTSTITGMGQNSLMSRHLSNAKAGADTAIKTFELISTRALRKLPVTKLAHNPDYGREANIPLSTKVLPKTIAKPANLHLMLVVDSITNDEVGIFFNKAWSDKFDTNDSYDLDGQGSKAFLSSYTSDGVRTSVNAMGDYKDGKRIKLYVVAVADGIYQLQMSSIANFNTNKYSVFLIDNLKKDSLDLTLYKSYNFNFSVADTGSYANRFVLAIEHKPVAHYALLAFAGQKVTKGVQLNWKTQNEVNTTTFVLQKLTANNTYVFLDSLTSDSVGAYAYTDQHPTLGNNTYRLQQTDALGNMTYSAPVTIGYNSASPNGELTIYPNPSKSVITVTLTTSSIATQIATADIYNTSGTLIAHRVVSSNSFNHDISNYKLGVYIIELKNSNGVIVGKSKFVKVE